MVVLAKGRYLGIDTTFDSGILGAERGSMGIRRCMTRDQQEMNVLELVSLSIFIFLIKYFTHRSWWSVWAEAAVSCPRSSTSWSRCMARTAECTGRGLLEAAFDRPSAEPLLMITT